MNMPEWLFNSLKLAFENKNLNKIRLLNDCWFYYNSMGVSKYEPYNT